jgi:hypothetical protein
MRNFLWILVCLWISQIGVAQNAPQVLLLDLKPGNYFSFKQQETYQLYENKEEKSLIHEFSKTRNVFLEVEKRIGSLIYVKLTYSNIVFTDANSLNPDFEPYKKWLQSLDGSALQMVLHTTGEVANVQGLDSLRIHALELAKAQNLTDTARILKYFDSFFPDNSIREEFESLLKIYTPKKVKEGDKWRTKLPTYREYKSNIRNDVQFVEQSEEAYYFRVVSKINSKRSFLDHLFKASEIVGERQTTYRLDLKHRFPRTVNSVVSYKINPKKEEKHYLKVIINWQRL